MIILKLDIAKTTGWAIMDDTTSPKGLIDYGFEKFWDREAIHESSKVATMFNFVNDIINKYGVEQVWIEQLNYFRNARTTRSIIQQQSGAHLASLQNNLISTEIPTQSSYRKKEALEQVKKLYPERAILSMDICDAIMLGERKN